MKVPKISFVCPTYNNSAYLSNTIFSLIEQTMKEIEIIIIDDKSTDSTNDMRKFFEEKDKRIKWVQLPERMGAAYCRNVGNRMAKAEIICVMDSGDLSHPDRAVMTLDIFEKHPEVDVIAMGVEVINHFGQPAYQETPELYTGQKKPVMSHPTMAYRKTWIIKYPYREECKETDQYEAMIATLYNAGAKFAVVHDVFVKKMHIIGRRIPEAWKYKKAIYEEFGWEIPDFLKGVKSVRETSNA